MARPERFELPTTKFVAWYSIQLSYGREEPRIVQHFPVLVKTMFAAFDVSASVAGLRFRQHGSRRTRDASLTAFEHPSPAVSLR